jgi:hypothetical protein
MKEAPGTQSQDPILAAQFAVKAECEIAATGKMRNWKVMIPFAMVRCHRKIWRSSCIIVLGLLVLSGGCKGKGSSSAANMPIADGQYLTYTVSLDAMDASHQRVHLDDSYKYEFKAADNGEWQVIGSSGQYHTGSGSSYTIDKNAAVVAQGQSEFSKWKVGRRFSDLWLAPDERQNGQVAHPLDDVGDYAVGQEAVWQRWHVLPAVSAGLETKETRYYEATTGWLVGTELVKNDDGSKRVDILSDTNISIPTQ